MSSGKRMPRLRWLRGTPDGQAARSRFSGEKVRSLMAIIENGPGFRDDRARRRLAPDLRWWAYRCIEARDAALPRAARRTIHRHCQELTPPERRGVAPDPRPRDTRQALDRLSAYVNKASDSVARAARAWAALKPAELEALRPHLPRPDARGEAQAPEAPSHAEPGLAQAMADVARQNEPLRAWLQALDRMHRQLAWLARAAEAGRDAVKGDPGPRTRDLHRNAILDFARLWFEATGSWPTRRVDRQGQRSGSFRDFVHAAMRPIWPGLPSVDGLIDEVCSQPASAG
jgi:hypothetical protein